MTYSLNPTVVVLKHDCRQWRFCRIEGLNPTVVVLKRVVKNYTVPTVITSQSNRSGFETPFAVMVHFPSAWSQSNRSGFETVHADCKLQVLLRLNPTVVVLKRNTSTLEDIANIAVSIQP